MSLTFKKWMLMDKRSRQMYPLADEASAAFDRALAAVTRYGECVEDCEYERIVKGCDRPPVLRGKSRKDALAALRQARARVDAVRVLASEVMYMVVAATHSHGITPKQYAELNYIHARADDCVDSLTGAIRRISKGECHVPHDRMMVGEIGMIAMVLARISDRESWNFYFKKKGRKSGGKGPLS